MKIIYGINNIKKFKNPVVAMGVFDGVHRGHRLILKSAANKARAVKGTSVAVTFWPHPHKKEALYSLEHRLRLISDLGLDACIVINFTSRFSCLKAERFVRRVLVDDLGLRYLYVGKNFRFGSKAAGDFNLLKRLSLAYGFKLKGFGIIKTKSRPVSSTLIRSLIKKGDLGHAQKLLCHPVSVLGTVIRGVSLGRRLGFPTANINPHHEVIPPAGIYAVRVKLENKILGGACYIGTRPTIHNNLTTRQPKNHKIHIEVFIFDFNNNIYGKYLEINFVKRIRGDRKFPSLALLSCHIRKDIISARNILSRHS